MTVLFIVLGSLFLLILFLLVMPLSLRFAYEPEKFSLTLRYLFIRLNLSPEALMKRIDKHVTPKEAKQEIKDTLEKEKRDPVELLGTILDLLRSANGPWNILRRHIIFYRVRFYLLICGDDAHETAIKYAGFSNAVFALLTLAGSTFVLKDPTVFLYPDFSGIKSRYDLSFRIRVRPIFAVIAAINLFWHFLMGRVRRQPIKTKGGMKHEPTASR